MQLKVKVCEIYSRLPDPCCLFDSMQPVRVASCLGNEMNLTVETSSTGGVDDAAELLLAEVRPCCLGARESAVKVNSLDQVEFLREKGLMSRNTCIY